MELDSLARRALDLAMDAGAGEAEAYAEDSEGREIRVFEGEVESLTDAAERGVGVRAWIDGRAGYAFGSDLSDDGLREIATAAVEAARVTDPDEHAAAPEPAGEPAAIDGLHDPGVAATPTAEKIALAQEIERACRGADSRVAQIEQTVYVDEDGRAAIASSKGVEASWEATSCYAYLQAIAGEDSERETGLGVGMGRAPGALDAEAIGTEAAVRAASLLGAVKPRSSQTHVILDPIVAASFIGLVGGTLSADSVQRGRSPFAGKLGAEIANPALTIADDGIDPEGLGSAPVDGEGTPRRRTPLIDGGTLRTYLYDSYTARREGGGTSSTGNAARGGYRGPPSVSTSNLVVATGDFDLEDLLAEAGEGVYIMDVAGLHSGVNPVTGQFSVGASGRMIQAGRLGEPVSEFTIASDLQSMLESVRATGAEARWVPFGGSVKTPAVLIGEMAVAGT
jgi:PmbA protein